MSEERSACEILPLEQTLDGTIGIEVLELGDDFVRGRIAVTDRVRQPYGIVHGGAMAALAESLTSMGTARAAWQPRARSRWGRRSTPASCARSARATSTRSPACGARAGRPGTGRSRSPTTRAACARCCARRSPCGTRRAAASHGGRETDEARWPCSSAPRAGTTRSGRASFYPARPAAEPLPRALRARPQRLRDQRDLLPRCSRRASGRALGRGVPADFRFAVKAHRRLTHRKRIALERDAAFLQRVPRVARAARRAARLPAAPVPRPSSSATTGAGGAARGAAGRISVRAASSATSPGHRPRSSELVAGRAARSASRRRTGEVPERCRRARSPTCGCTASATRDEARAGWLALLTREAEQRDVYAFAKHKDVPADDPAHRPSAWRAGWLSREAGS